MSHFSDGCFSVLETRLGCVYWCDINEKCLTSIYRWQKTLQNGLCYRRRGRSGESAEAATATFVSPAFALFLTFTFFQTKLSGFRFVTTTIENPSETGETSSAAFVSVVNILHHFDVGRRRDRHEPPTWVHPRAIACATSANQIPTIQR